MAKTIENTRDDDFINFLNEIYKLDLIKLGKLKKDIIIKFSDYLESPIIKTRLEAIEIHMERLKNTPSKEELRNEALKYYCLSRKYFPESSPTTNAFYQMYKKYPYIEGYFIQDLTQGILRQMLSCKLGEEKKICEPYIMSNKLTKEELHVDFEYKKCDHCGNLNSNFATICSKCRRWFL